MNENNKRQMSDSGLDEVSGGAQNTAPCTCPFCGGWVQPILRGGKLFCPNCGEQIGGTLGNVLSGPRSL